MSKPAEHKGRTSRRVAIVGPSARSMIHARGGLIRALVARRHRVMCLAPDVGTAEAAAIADLGATAAGYPLKPGAVRPLGDRRSTDAIGAALADWQPHAAIGYGLKPMLLTSLAARRAGTGRIVPLVSSLGELAIDPAAVPRLGLRWTMRRAFRASHAVVFHNRDDAARLASAGLIAADIPVHVVPGAGVDLNRFAALPLPDTSPGLVFLMIARLERSKGVEEFCEAARLVRARTPAARFVLAGLPGGPPTGPLDLGKYAASVEFAGEVEDVRELMAGAHVFVLPSWAEGMPPTVLQAMAWGRPIITTDVPGCRETVDERVNGVLVPPRDARALAAAIDSYIRRPELLGWMARASRLKAERRFDANAVNARLIEILDLDRDA